MKTFHCDCCQNTVFFENTECVQCGSKLAYLTDCGVMAAIKTTGDGCWKPLAAVRKHSTYKLCRNYASENVCNWALPTSDQNALCRCCRLNRTIPNLDQAGHRQAWFKLEAAKRRLIFGLINLGLPIESRFENPMNGLAFDFLSDIVPNALAPVLTGHNKGLITINVAEADDLERERRRVAMHEPYRTLLGHFRHESGHYYWDLLIAGTPNLEPFRRMFGDESQDYAGALKSHYERGPTPHWKERYVTEYASSHPWEDWAETWAHYLHIFDALETASACGLSLAPGSNKGPAFKPIKAAEMRKAKAFDTLIERWLALAQVMNNFNRGLGMQDPYPFVLSPPVVAKLGLVHGVIAGLHQKPVPRFFAMMWPERPARALHAS